MKLVFETNIFEELTDLDIPKGLVLFNKRYDFWNSRRVAESGFQECLSKSTHNHFIPLVILN